MPTLCRCARWSLRTLASLSGGSAEPLPCRHDGSLRAALPFLIVMIALASLAACSPSPTPMAPTRHPTATSSVLSLAEASGASVEFVLPAGSMWQRTADGGYAVSGGEDTFAWSSQPIQGDFELSADVESDFANYGEAMILVYGDGLGWTPGCLIFNITGYWQSIRAHSVYDPESRTVAVREKPLDLERRRYHLTIRVAENKASLFVDERLVVSTAMSPQFNREGYLALVKWGGSAPATYEHIMLKTARSATSGVAGAIATRTSPPPSPSPSSTPRPTATLPPTRTPTPTDTPRPTVTLTPSETPTPTSTPEPDAIVKRPSAQVREGPGTEYATLGTLQPGAEMEVLGEHGGCAWLWIAYGEGFGWVRHIEGTVELRLPCASLSPGLYRPRTGYIKRISEGRGRGELKVENGTEKDAVLVLAAGEQTLASAYVRAGASFTLDGIRDGEYVLYFATGEGWDGRTFTEAVRRSRFEDTLPYKTTQTTYSAWTITLHPVVGGAATTESVDADEFPSVGE